MYNLVEILESLLSANEFCYMGPRSFRAPKAFWFKMMKAWSLHLSSPVMFSTDIDFISSVCTCLELLVFFIFNIFLESDFYLEKKILFLWLASLCIDMVLY